MKIFITGATGSIGAYVVKMLSERGHTVHALVRSAIKSQEILFRNVVLFDGDIMDADSIDRAMKDCQQVYHLAAIAKVWAKNSEEFYNVNVQGTVNVLESAKKNEIEKIVVTSTAGVFGPSIHGIVNEEKIREIDLFNEYEGSKLMAESVIKDYVNIHRMDIVIVSPTRVYGPFLFGKPASITFMIDKYVNGSWRIYPGTGREIGNYIYIEDAALGHILAMEKGRKGHTYLLAGENHDYISFYSILGEAAGIKRKMFQVPMWVQMSFAKLQLLMAENFGKTPVVTPKWVSKAKYHWEVSPEKSVKELGLPITPFVHGMKNTVNYLRSK